MAARAGIVALEYATEVALELGTLTAGLHAAVASDPTGHGLPDAGAPAGVARRAARMGFGRPCAS